MKDVKIKKIKKQKKKSYPLCLFLYFIYRHCHRKNEIVYRQSLCRHLSKSHNSFDLNKSRAK